MLSIYDDYRRQSYPRNVIHNLEKRGCIVSLQHYQPSKTGVGRMQSSIRLQVNPYKVVRMPESILV